MLNELNDILTRLQKCREDLFALREKLDVNKNSKSREELLQAQLNVMQATGKLTALLDKARNAKGVSK